MESQITATNINKLNSYNIKSYIRDIKDGFEFIKQEEGIRNIYTYMSITSGASQGINIMTQAFFQTQSWLNVTMLGLLKSAEMLGRLISGFLHYFKEIPVDRRYQFTKIVYTVYDVFDAVLLFLPYPWMLINRFICGGLGTASATIRSTAVQCYLPSEMRARVNAIFSVIMSIGGIIFQLVAGIVGQILPYPYAALMLGVITLISMIYLIIIPKQKNRVIYEAIRR